MLTPASINPPVAQAHHTLIERVISDQTAAHIISTTPVGAELCEALQCRAGREYLITYCLRGSGAHRVLGLALGRGAEHPRHTMATYTTAAFATLALDHRARAILLLDAVFNAEGIDGND